MPSQLYKITAPLCIRHGSHHAPQRACRTSVRACYRTSVGPRPPPRQRPPPRRCHRQRSLHQARTETRTVPHVHAASHCYITAAPDRSHERPPPKNRKWFEIVGVLP